MEARSLGGGNAKGRGGLFLNMTPEAQRIAIAEACGWNIPSHCKTKRLMAGESKRAVAGAPPDFGWHPDGRSGDLPDYLNDLNAMHAALKILSDAQKYEYLEQLAFVSATMDGFCVIEATSDHCAEAFLRTLNLWK